VKFLSSCWPSASSNSLLGHHKLVKAEWRSVHLWMNESENACEKHDHRKAQHGNGEPLYGASRCLFGRWLAHASFLVRCLAPPTCSIERSFSTPHAALPLPVSKRGTGIFLSFHT
jgi:hypothetical protein